jgi:hypothetical protein
MEALVIWQFYLVSLFLNVSINVFSVDSVTISCGRVFYSFTIVRSAVSCDRLSRAAAPVTFICRPFECRVGRRAHLGLSSLNNFYLPKI